MKIMSADVTMVEKIRKLVDMKDSCKGEDHFDFLLVQSLYLNEEYDKSLAYIEEFEAKTGISLNSLLCRGLLSLQIEDYQKSTKIFNQIKIEYPDSHIGHYYSGVVLFIEGNYLEAINNFNEALSIGYIGKIYSYLAMSYHSIDEHQRAINNFNNAYKNDNGILKDRDVMIAASRSFAELSEFELSRRCLAFLLKEGYEIESDQEIQKAYIFLQVKMKEAGAAGTEKGVGDSLKSGSGLTNLK